VLGPDLQTIPLDYAGAIPWDAIRVAERVILVDFSYPLDIMQEIQDQAELIWIDHHQSAIQSLQQLETLPGLRALDKAACSLTWLYFYPKKPLPQCVQYIGDRDLWRHEFSQTAPFCAGLRLMDTSPQNDTLWVALLQDDLELIQSIMETGEILDKARKMEIRGKVANAGYEVVFQGYRTLVINERGSGELGEHIRSLGYELGYCYQESMKDGVRKTVVTLFSNQVDVSIIAQEFGGGGHPGAAGFSFESSGSPFPSSAVIDVPHKP
jgi:oligoribonuclease NrnB/cAMP/cGMP phosphodiesterase (DHH superfamily)